MILNTLWRNDYVQSPTGCSKTLCIYIRIASNANSSERPFTYSWIVLNKKSNPPTIFLRKPSFYASWCRSIPVTKEEKLQREKLQLQESMIVRTSPFISKRSSACKNQSSKLKVSFPCPLSILRMHDFGEEIWTCRERTKVIVARYLQQKILTYSGSARSLSALDCLAGPLLSWLRPMLQTRQCPAALPKPRKL